VTFSLARYLIRPERRDFLFRGANYANWKDAMFVLPPAGRRSVQIDRRSGDNPPDGETAPLFRRILSRFRSSRHRNGRSLSEIVTPTV
jgi:hypothetical protein